MPAVDDQGFRVEVAAAGQAEPLTLAAHAFAEFVANRNRLTISNLRGSVAPRSWKDEAEESEKEGGLEVQLEDEIPFRRYTLFFANLRDLSFERAMRIVRRFADEGELGIPLKRKDNWIDVPIQIASERE